MEDAVPGVRSWYRESLGFGVKNWAPWERTIVFGVICEETAYIGQNHGKLGGGNWARGIW